jgi:hypothetical protein
LLTESDTCLYIGEFTAGAGFGTSTNDLIINFKIEPKKLRANPNRQRWKNWAIKTVAKALAKYLGNLPEGRVVVPIPGSKIPGDPEYDDRMLRALREAPCARPIPFREIIKQRCSTKADHEGGRQSYDELKRNCYVDEKCALPVPSKVILLDDVITDGKHFKVCQELLTNRYGNIDVVGLFIARRIRQDVALDFDILEDNTDTE